jgi:hypothetical protein
VHTYNNLVFMISNQGVMGSEDAGRIDCETNLTTLGGGFPKGSGVDYLFQGALWIGAIVGEDTLVSVGADGWQLANELYPCQDPSGAQNCLSAAEASDPHCAVARRSNRPGDPFFDETAHSDLEFTAFYNDTLTDAAFVSADWTGREYVPINVEVTQNSYSWSVDYAQDFAIVDFVLKNIGTLTLNKLYLGLYWDGDVGHTSIPGTERAQDDICGILELTPRHPCGDCDGGNFQQQIDLTYITDNDGDPGESNQYGSMSATSLLGAAVMKAPAQGPNVKKVSFNWFNSNGSSSFDWGPMLRATRRDFGTGGLGTPEGDRNKYYLLSNGEHDYTQYFAAEDYSADGWLPPSVQGRTLAQGGDTRFVISYGDFTIAPGDSLGISLAFVGGENVHYQPDAFTQYMPDFPSTYLENLDFRDAGDNAIWANWVYDNPGVDTDNDNFYGKYCMISEEEPRDSCWWQGDGVPDFRAATAPPPPIIRYRTEFGNAFLRWNGYYSENTEDPFTHVVDFEGYRIYLGRSATKDDMAMLESRDFFDFKRYRWDDIKTGWILSEPPLRLDSLQILYGDDFDPSDWPCRIGMVIDEGFPQDEDHFCFEACDWNQSLEGWLDGAPVASVLSSGVKKTYQDEIEEGQILPILDSTRTDWWVKDINPLTGDSVMYHKYWEYEYQVGNLLPSVPWFFSVTAFDFGEFKKEYGEARGLESQESSPLSNAVELWAINDASVVLDRKLSVQVYPNPYIGDQRYYEAKYERPKSESESSEPDHLRRIHFVNLPPKCTLKIYTLDGDLVRSIDHEGPTSDWSSKIYWDMRTRNNELVASGIYLFSVESEWGNQVGKFVIIL